MVKHTPVWVKVARDIETRKLWRFRSHFYAALDTHFEHLGRSDPRFQNKALKLFWSSGGLFLNFDDDYHPLLSFKKNISEYMSDITANFNVLSKFGLDISQANELLTRSLNNAGEQ